MKLLSAIDESKDVVSKEYVDSNFTSQSILPNDAGEVKTRYRVSLKGYTGSGTTIWWYPVCELPADNSSNYASIIISGRIGGWVNENMSSINALVWNRNGDGISLLDIAGGATAMSSIWNICDIVLYRDETSKKTKVYLKCKSYFTFDLNFEYFQSGISILYDGTYVTTEPSGTLTVQASTSTKRMEIINSKTYVAGSELAKKSDIPTVNNATLTIQKNGSNVQTFTANQSTNATANIEVPTKVSELTNDEGYTSNVGTITGINMNGASKGTSGVVDLGTVLTSHQSIKTVNNNTITGTGNVSVGTITKVQANGTDVASSGTANIPAASTSAFGVTKLSNATDSTSEALAATPKAVKAAYDLAASKGTGTITGVSVNGTSIATSGVANITSMPASILSGAIPSAVTATTQSQGDNSTKVATTAYVDAKPTILSGTSDPASNLGKNGDIYIKIAS